MGKCDCDPTSEVAQKDRVIDQRTEYMEDEWEEEEYDSWFNEQMAKDNRFRMRNGAEAKGLGSSD